MYLLELTLIYRESASQPKMIRSQNGIPSTRHLSRFAGEETYNILLLFILVGTAGDFKVNVYL